VSTETTYDYIIAGAGGAGLSLLHYLLKSPVLSNRSILVIDRNLNKTNDRTWCYWEQGSGTFDPIVTKKWNHISIHQGAHSYKLPTQPYQYKMIQGIDFYNQVFELANRFPNVHFKEAIVKDIETFEEKGVVSWEGGSASAQFVFSSLLQKDWLYKISHSAAQIPFLWQHFKGKLIEYAQPIFDQETAKLMDFNVDQQGATGFMYVLPLSSTKALVEYTLFSKHILQESFYDEQIDLYLDKSHPGLQYKTLHAEMGAIPMTTQPMAKSKTPIYVIGTLGNAVKPSTGFGFHFIQEQTSSIVHQLENNLPVNTEVHTTRHQFYDAVLLDILYFNKMKGSEIFSRIFAKNKASTVFKFLSNTSSIKEDIQIMRSLPTWLFLRTAIKLLLRRP
jgi:lycopene beta-cyclase